MTVVPRAFSGEITNCEELFSQWFRNHYKVLVEGFSSRV